MRPRLHRADASTCAGARGRQRTSMTAVRPRVSSTNGPTRHRARHVADTAQPPYLNRELSWLEWDARVLHLARDERDPLLERVRFLAIFASNLDEFFQVRISGLREQVRVRAGTAPVSPDGLTASEQIAAARRRVH
jgi:hypothetical protein